MGDLSSPPVPDGTSADDFVGALRRLRLWAGSPSMRRLSGLGGTKVVSGTEVAVIPHSTISYVLAGSGLPKLPRLEFVEAYVAACLATCGFPERDVREQVEHWRTTWRHLSLPSHTTSPPPAQATTSSPPPQTTAPSPPQATASSPPPQATTSSSPSQAAFGQTASSSPETTPDHIASSSSSTTPSPATASPARQGAAPQATDTTSAPGPEPASEPPTGPEPPADQDPADPDFRPRIDAVPHPHPLSRVRSVASVSAIIVLGVAIGTSAANPGALLAGRAFPRPPASSPPAPAGDQTGANVQITTQADTYTGHRSSPDRDSWLLVGGGTASSSPARAYLRFAVPPAHGRTLERAQLTLWNHESPSCGPAVDAGIQVRRITTPWSDESLRAGDQPETTGDGAATNRRAYGRPKCDGGTSTSTSPASSRRGPAEPPTTACNCASPTSQTR
ncbi:DNRLRE domain-containing protein [Nonomuraea sp. NPDC005650]|uniref:DNRLRE domain-containing protein n=1 Tax=Nonomuraea sp. NPDC005650 TaxID=3157045 RepID=UPI0033AD4AC6